MIDVSAKADAYFESLPLSSRQRGGRLITEAFEQGWLAHSHDGNTIIGSAMAKRIQAALVEWDKAVEGSSGDAEYEAGCEMSDILGSLLAEATSA